jgi:hypothetical protein
VITHCHIFFPDGDARRINAGGNIRRIYVGAPSSVVPRDVAPSALCVEDSLGTTQVYINVAYSVVTAKGEDDASATN